MIRPRLPRVRAAINAFLDRHSVEAPAGHLGSLDIANGMGECPPLTDAQADTLWNTLTRNYCRTCDFTPTDGATVLCHTPGGGHLVTYGDDPRVHTVYDQATPLASEVEAWLAGGAR